MNPQVTCPNCSRQVIVSQRHAGQTAICPFCGRRMPVPGEPAPAAPSPTPEKPLADPSPSDAGATDTKAAETEKKARTVAAGIGGGAPAQAKETPSSEPEHDDWTTWQPSSESNSPAEAHQYTGKPNGTNVGLLRAAPLAGVLMAAWYVAVVMPLRSTYVGELFLERGWVTYAIVFLTSLSAATLLLKSRKLRRQRSSLSLDVLPQRIATTILPEHVEQFLAHIRTLRGNPKHSFLLRRISRALEYFKTRNSVEEVAGSLNTQAELDATSVESSYTMVKVFIWAIPILGFIGTVLGISGAVGSFSDSIQTTQELDVIKHSLGMVTSNLAYAFDTTLVALIASVLLMIPASSMQKAEEDLLNSVDGYCNEHLLPRLYDATGEQDGSEQEEEAARQAEQFQRFAEQLDAIGVTLTQAVTSGWKDARGQMRQEQQTQLAKLDDVGVAIREDRAAFLAEFQAMLDIQAKTLTGLTHSIAAERESSFAQQQTLQKNVIGKLSEVVADVAKEREASLAAMQAVQREQATNLATAIEAVGNQRESFLKELQATQDTQVGKLTEVVAAMAASADRVQRQIADTQQSQVQGQKDVVAVLAENLRQLQNDVHEQHRAEAATLETMAAAFTESLTGLPNELGEVRQQFAETLEAVAPAIREGIAKVVDDVEGSLQEKFQLLEQTAALAQQQSAALSDHLNQSQAAYTEAIGQVADTLRDGLKQVPDLVVASQEVPLGRLSEIAASVAGQAEMIRQEMAAARSAIETSHDVARQLQEANGTARQTIDELVGCFGEMTNRQQQFATAQRALITHLKKMVTTEAFGEMLDSMHVAMLNMHACTDQLKGQVEQLVDERSRPGVWRSLFTRSNSTRNGQGANHGQA